MYLNIEKIHGTEKLHNWSSLHSVINEDTHCKVCKIIRLALVIIFSISRILPCSTITQPTFTCSKSTMKTSEQSP